MPPGVLEEEKAEAEKSDYAEFKSNPRNKNVWRRVMGNFYHRQRPAKDPSPIAPPPLIKLSVIAVVARLEHFWPDGAAAVSVKHDRIGWLEFDIPIAGLPQGIQPRDMFALHLRLDPEGNVISHQVSLSAEIIRPAEPSIGSLLSARIPQPPKDWNDPDEVANYEKMLAEWELKSGMARVGIQSE